MSCALNLVSTFLFAPFVVSWILSPLAKLYLRIFTMYLIYCQKAFTRIKHGCYLLGFCLNYCQNNGYTRFFKWLVRYEINSYDMKLLFNYVRLQIYFTFMANKSRDGRIIHTVFIANFEFYSSCTQHGRTIRVCVTLKWSSYM